MAGRGCIGLGLNSLNGACDSGTPWGDLNLAAIERAWCCEGSWVLGERNDDVERRGVPAVAYGLGRWVRAAFPWLLVVGTFIYATPYTPCAIVIVGTFVAYQKASRAVADSERSPYQAETLKRWVGNLQAALVATAIGFVLLVGSYVGERQDFGRKLGRICPDEETSGEVCAEILAARDAARAFAWAWTEDPEGE